MKSNLKYLSSWLSLETSKDIQYEGHVFLERMKTADIYQGLKTIFGLYQELTVGGHVFRHDSVLLKRVMYKT